MKTVSILLLFLFNVLLVTAQDTKIIFLKENTKQAQEKSYDQLFTPKALERRANHHVEFDESDLPVNEDILNSLAQDGEVLNVSRWLNAVTFRSELTTEELKLKYDFIDRIQVVQTSLKSTKMKLEIETKSLDYGLAVQQIEQLNIDCLMPRI